MKRGTSCRVLAGVLVAAGWVASAWAQQAEQDQQPELERGPLQASLSGYQEVPTLWSPGTGDISVRMNEEGNIEYQLRYSGVTTPVQQAHLHLGTEGVNGDIIAFLCSNLPNPPADVPACPEMEGEVGGTMTAASVVGPEDQGIAPGELQKLVDAINNGAVYANVHTEQYPAGELRGQVGTPPIGTPGEDRAQPQNGGS